LGTFFLAHDVDGRRVEAGLDVGGIELFDHLDRCPAILGDRVNIRPLHQAQTDVGMAQAIGGARLTVAVGFQFLFVENGFEQFALPFGTEKVRGLRQASLFIGSSPSRLVDPQRTRSSL
jgi:hypothetical protein